MDAQSQCRSERKRYLNACDACRRCKIRCLPDADSDTKCQRCKRLQRQCVYSEVKGRPRKTDQDQGRVVELEKKVERLTSLLEFPSGASLDVHKADLPRDTAAQEWLPRSVYPSPTSDIANPTSSSGSVAHTCILTAQETQKLIAAFRADFASFPFLVIPRVPVAQLQLEHPMLVMAMLVTASRGNYETQCALDLQYRRILSQRIIIDAERSLDTIQGLLIYIAWYYYRFKVMDKQLQVFLGIAVVLILDMDLEKTGALNQETDLSIEIKRTLIGIYYFSSYTSLMTRKPLLLKSSLRLWECGRSLAVANHVQTDTCLIHYIQVSSFAEEIANSFGYLDDTRPQQSIASEIQSIESKIRIFDCRLEQIRCALPTDQSATASLLLACDSVAIYLYEVCFHLADSGAFSGKDIASMPQATSILVKLLWACLMAVNKFFDRWIRLSSVDIVAGTSIEKGRLAHALLVLIKLAFVRIPDHEGFPLRDACNISCYLDLIGAKVAEQSVTPPGIEPQDCFSQFQSMIGFIKMWYERIAAMGTSGSSDELKGTNPLQLPEIAKAETFAAFEWNNLDAFLAEATTWTNAFE